jgi:ATP-dependent helicase/nuclease subunit A
VLICGWEVRGTQEGSWYQRVGDALRGLGAARQDFAAWPGESLVIECAQTEKAGDAPRRAAGEAAALPSWAGQAPDWRAAPLPPEPHIPRPLAPSRPDGAGLGSVPPSRSPLLQAGQPDRFSRGLVMHALLQHLPEVPPSDRARAAAAYLRRLNAPDALAAQALAVLDAPALAPLFGPGSRAEQSVCGLIGPHIVSGQVDRLAILPGRVLIADYKTNRAPPDSVDKVPVLYLRQMAAYRAVLARLYPDRDVECVLIWTEAPRVMILPGALLDSYAPGAAPSPAHA